jgi:hypothetical protein
MDACTFCGQSVEEHDPVYVEEASDDGRVPAGQFCNYACLVAHIEAENLTTGTACRYDP